jgi:hypothetical protein
MVAGLLHVLLLGHVASCVLSPVDAAAGEHGLTAEVYANTVMRGNHVCKTVLPNGFHTERAGLCGPRVAGLLVPGGYSIRLTGTLAAPGPRQWHNFTVAVGRTALVRLWVDDHRLVDAWSPRTAGDTDAPTTPGLLPNITMGSERPVSVRVDLRPMDDYPLQLALSWTVGLNADHAPPVLIPPQLLMPEVSPPQAARRVLQEAAATGWNHWARRSQLAQIALPQQVGVVLGIENSSGSVYTAGLPEPRKTQVRMGPHAYDGSFSSLSVVPFPDSPMNQRANITVETAHVVNLQPPLRSAVVAGAIGDCVIVATTNSTAPLSMVVAAHAFWGAAANISANVANNTVAMQAGDLGTITITVTGGQVSLSSLDPETKTVAITARFTRPDQPLVVSLSFSGRVYSQAEALRAVDYQRAATEAALVSGGERGGGLSEAYDAMATVTAWNVNFDPRVAVTCPVSRTFEANYDFIFFDWDMYFLSLMAGTQPAAEDDAAWLIAISNLIEVTQTRSVYGQVMNKRSAAGDRSSDTNDRTEPLVGAAVVLSIYKDSIGTKRETTMKWVVELLYPTLLQWNQWSWTLRRYKVGADPPHGGLLVLGADNDHLPCEGGTVTSPPRCSGKAFGALAAVLESGMDNSPMCEFDSVRISPRFLPGTPLHYPDLCCRRQHVRSAASNLRRSNGEHYLDPHFSLW